MSLDHQKPLVTIKEARKLLGAAYKRYTDEQVSEIVRLLHVIAKDFIQNTVPK